MRNIAILVCVATLAVAGCSKKAEEAPSAEGGGLASGEAVVAKPPDFSPGKELIPGENAVKEALSQKNYTAAVERYSMLKQAVATPEQQDEYMSLYGQMRSLLEESASSDPKAAEALSMFRALRNGR